MTHAYSNSTSMFIVFGRPGSGKSTITKKTEEIIIAKGRNNNNSNNDSNMNATTSLCLDLDICVPKWMRDNFTKGIYPTLNQREEFAINACNYVNEKVQNTTTNIITEQEQKQQKPSNKVFIISFSFVNNDLRKIFQEHFPKAKWILIDTNEETAQERMNQREDHFYKGTTTMNNHDPTMDDAAKEIIDTASTNTATDNDDTSEWKFAPVDFEHVTLNGSHSIDENANRLYQIIIWKELK